MGISSAYRRFIWYDQRQYAPPLHLHKSFINISTTISFIHFAVLTATLNFLFSIAISTTHFIATSSTVSAILPSTVSAMLYASFLTAFSAAISTTLLGKT